MTSSPNSTPPATDTHHLPTPIKIKPCGPLLKCRNHPSLASEREQAHLRSRQIQCCRHTAPTFADQQLHLQRSPIIQMSFRGGLPTCHCYQNLKRMPSHIGQEACAISLCSRLSIHRWHNIIIHTEE